jgi:hypothetical protein
MRTVALAHVLDAERLSQAVQQVDQDFEIYPALCYEGC